MTKTLANAARDYLASKSASEQRRIIGSRMSTHYEKRSRCLKASRYWRADELNWLGKVPDPRTTIRIHQ